MILLKIRTFSAFFSLSFSSHFPFLNFLPAGRRHHISSEGTAVIENDI
ncbi:hypothetical protein HDEF_1100 [Candidatus Hamiltonella defensa 5AT (Acyrthosiphon pisum)]|uniref:Uncharacterized protein n=1 Tax=Hamiltonella defensa subsp. Acyrthosiphon pisum (strain 5AT) TaxID=572265 RepID=C4K5D1_HAMD5|nr:hypothetical protein HDEF_1100 [Candidatus Hamiltonella defensa 5AT (Acyrthosiphon pisum)]